MDQDILRFRIVVLISTAFIILGFVLSYLLWGHNRLPFGWDTPYYIVESRVAATQGFAGLLAVQGPYNFLYQLCSGLLVWSGISPFTVQIFLPIGISALLPYLLSRIARIEPDLKLATVVALATPGWYAVYIIVALPANLLGLVLILTAVPFFYKSNSIRHPMCVVGLVLVGLASFSHIESTLFFVAIMAIASLAFSAVPRSIALVTAAAALPASVLYALHLVQLFALTSYSLPVYSLEPFWFWLEIFGPLLPIAAYGLMTSMTGRRSPLKIFIIVWTLCSLLIGISQYFNAQTYIFAIRAAAIIPAPILAAVGFIRLRSWANTGRHDLIGLRNVRKWVLMTAFITLIIAWPVTYWVAAYQNERVYLTTSAAQRLQWISGNMKFTTTPIFIYDDLDELAGGNGNLFNNWVGAIVGQHLAYLGRVDYLVQVHETPFSNTASRLISALFMKQIYGSGITNRTSLLEHPIIIVEDFYNPYPLPTYFAGFFHQVYDGVFQSNSTSLQTLDNITLPMSSSLVNSQGPWYTIRRSWAQSIYSLEANVSSASTDLEASVLAAIPADGTYALNLRYWDGTGNNLQVVLDRTTIGALQYSGTDLPSIKSFTGLHLTAGVHSLTVKVDKNGSGLQYASLDYLAINRS